MKLNDFFEKHLVDGCITGTFTTSKSIEAIYQLNQSKRIQFDITLQKDTDEVTFIVPKHNKKFGEGILRKTLIQTEMAAGIIFLRWIPEYQPMFEGFNIKISPTSDKGGIFNLHITNPNRFLFWKEQLERPDSMRTNS